MATPVAIGWAGVCLRTLDHFSRSCAAKALSTNQQTDKGCVSSEDKKRVCSCETGLQCKLMFKNFNCIIWERVSEVSKQAREWSEQAKQA